MAIAHDAQTRFPTTDSSGFDITTGDRTFTHTPVGTPAGVVVVICCEGTTAPVSGVLYNGVAMTLKQSAVDTSEAGSVWVYTLTDQAIASGAKTVTLQGCTSVNKWVTCSTVTSATGWSTVNASNKKDTTTAANPTMNVVTTASSLLYGGLHGGANAPTSYVSPSGYSGQYNADYGQLSARSQRSTSPVAAGTIAFNFTYSTSDDYCLAAVALAERAAPTTYYGATAMAITFTKAVVGRMTFFGQTAMTITFIKDVKGGQKFFGQTATSITFVKDVQGFIARQSTIAITANAQDGNITHDSEPGALGANAWPYSSDTVPNLVIDLTEVYIRQLKRADWNYGEISIGTLNFDTSSLPDDAVIVGATLQMQVNNNGVLGTMQKSLELQWYDFGGSIDLSDWVYALPSVDKSVPYATWSAWVVGDVVNIDMPNAATGINKTGMSGIRLAFASGDPGAGQNENFITFATLEHATYAEPKLIVYYISAGVTFYGVTTFPVTFVKDVSGQRKTFSQIAAPFMFVEDIAGLRKTFSQIIAPFTFTKDVIGQRKTFGQVVTPFTFVKDVNGKLETFGQIVTPFIFIKDVSGLRRAFGQVTTSFTFVKDVIGQRKTFGQIAAPFTFVKDVLGNKTTFGQTATSIVTIIVTSGVKTANTFYGIVTSPFIFTKSVIGQRKTFGQISASFTFVKDVIGQRKTFGQIAAPFTFVKDVIGQRKTFGQIAAPFTFVKDVAGNRIASTLYGIITSPFLFGKFGNYGDGTYGDGYYSGRIAGVIGYRKTFSQIIAPFTFTKDVIGQRKTFGQITAPFIFTESVSGTRKTFSRVDLPLIFTDQTSGQKKTFGRIEFPIDIQISVVAEFQGIRYGQASMSLVFDENIVGTRKTFGQIVFPYFFTQTTQGLRKTFGRFDRPFTFTKAIIGQRTTFGRSELPINATIVVGGYRSVSGQVALSLVLGEQTTGQRKTFGHISSPYDFDAQLQGLRETFGLIDLPIDFVVDVKSGRVETYSSLGLEFLLSLETAGMVKPTEIILNLAKAIYLGSNPVEAVYTDQQKVWPK